MYAIKYMVLVCVLFFNRVFSWLLLAVVGYMVMVLVARLDNRTQKNVSVNGIDVIASHRYRPRFGVLSWRLSAPFCF